MNPPKTSARRQGAGTPSPRPALSDPPRRRLDGVRNEDMMAADGRDAADRRIPREPDFMQRLREARDAGRRVRLRVSVGFLVIGIPLAIAAMATCLVLFSKNVGLDGPQVDSSPHGAFTANSLTPAAVTITLMAILPTDRELVRAMIDMLVAMLLPVFIFSCVLVGITAEGHVHYRELTCSARANHHRCWELIYGFGMWPLSFAMVLGIGVYTSRPKTGAPARYSPAFFRLIWKAMKQFRTEYGNAKFCALFLACGFPGACAGFWIERAMPDDGYYAMPARSVLSMQWLAMRCFGLFHCLTMIPVFVLTYRTYGAADLDAISWAVFSLSNLIFLVLLPSPRNRRRAWAVLKRLAQTREEHEAATIGALLGTMTSARAFEYATRTFCVIDSGVVAHSDLAGGYVHVTVEGEMTTGSAAARTVNTRTRRVELGDCDAFVSHSWHDDSTDKWEAITKFTTEFEASMGRQPTYWLDIACVDEQRIGDSLAALPIYLAGCQQLLCLFGPTFPSRLWCLIELYAFLKMGASLERVRVKPVGKLTMGQALKMAQQVDVRNAKCYYESDRQRLCGIIEEGFGTFAEFNRTLSCLLVSRVDHV